MADNDLPWVEIGESVSIADLEDKAPLDNTFAYVWQAIFACQIVIPPFEERVKLKWGFSPAFLMDEARDRQRLFVEALHPNDCLAQEDWPDKRSVALRCVHDPADPGLRLSLLGKVCAPSPDAVRRAAAEFWHELHSTFPIDYQLIPAQTQTHFRHLCGWELLRSIRSGEALAQVRRFESPLGTGKEWLYLVGGWETLDRSEEQIWRALSASPEPVLLDILLRPTTLLRHERILLARMKENSNKASNAEDLNFAQPFATWNAARFERRLKGLARPYLLQVRLASATRMPDFVVRAVGSVLTRPAKADELALGYQVRRPVSKSEPAQWAPLIYWLERLPNPNAAPNYERLQDMVDLAEAHAVFRPPYPPESGLPGVSFDLGKSTM